MQRLVYLITVVILSGCSDFSGVLNEQKDAGVDPPQSSEPQEEVRTDTADASSGIADDGPLSELDVGEGRDAGGKVEPEIEPDVKDPKLPASGFDYESAYLKPWTGSPKMYRDNTVEFEILSDDECVLNRKIEDLTFAAISCKRQDRYLTIEFYKIRCRAFEPCEQDVNSKVRVKMLFGLAHLKDVPELRVRLEEVIEGDYGDGEYSLLPVFDYRRAK